MCENRKDNIITGNEIKGAIFDIDGVLLDSLTIWENLGARYLVSIGKLPEEGLGNVLFSMSMEQGAAYLKEHYAPEKTEEDILTGLSDMLRDFYYYEVKAKPGAKDLLAALQDSGIRITAATSSPRDHVERALARNGLLLYFEKIFTSSEIGSGKQSPQIYDAASACMGTPRHGTCVFEDSLYALKTAASAGYHTVGVYDEHGEKDIAGLSKNAEIFVRNLTDLLK